MIKEEEQPMTIEEIIKTLIDMSNTFKGSTAVSADRGHALWRCGRSLRRHSNAIKAILQQQEQANGK